MSVYGTGRAHVINTPTSIAITTPVGPAEQYVNLPGNIAGGGRDVVVRAEVLPAGDNIRVDWQIDAGANNRPNLGNAVKGGLVPGRSAANVVPADTLRTTTDGDGRTEILLRLSRWGGDSFRVRATESSGGTVAHSAWMTVWRKIWYQLTEDPILNLPPLLPTTAAYANVFIRLEAAAAAAVTYDQGWLDGHAVGYNNYYPRQMVQPGAAANPNIPVVGRHNQEWFKDLFVAVGPERQRRQAHVIAIGAQYHPDDNVFEFSGEMTANPAELRMPKSVLSPALDQAVQWFVEGWYRPKALLPGEWQPLVAGDIAFPADRGVGQDRLVRPRYIQVTLPLPQTDPPPSAGNPYEVKLRLIGAEGPYMGVSFRNGGTTANVYTPDYPFFPMTVAHEIGHAARQAPIKDGIVWSSRHPDGFRLPKHPHAYYERGGQGPHCSSVWDAVNAVNNPGALVWTGWLTREYAGTSGTCIMFHKVHGGCRGDFCTVCHDYFRAETLEALE